MRVSGKNFTTNIDGDLINVVTATLSITDNSGVSQTAGVPDGYVDGDVAAAGELVVNASNFRIISEMAKRAGSWRGMKVFDVSFYAKYGNDEVKVEAFECRIKIADLLDIDSKGGTASTFKIPFDVTGTDFVRIDGVPYLRPDETENIVQ